MFSKLKTFWANFWYAIKTAYNKAFKDIPKEATQEMIASGFALSLYTCTQGGANRVTVRCNAVEDSD